MTPLDKLVEQIHKTEGVLDSAATFITGIPALVTAAVQAALANGATAAQLAPVVALGDELAAKADAVKAAIDANSTPAP